MTALAGTEPAPAATATACFDLARVTTRRLTSGSSSLSTPSRQFLDHALPRFGLHTGGLDAAAGQGYLAMLRSLLADEPVEEAVDLTVLAFVVPDYELSELAGVGAACATPGSTAMFGVSDHGRVTSFLALRLATLLGGRRGVDRVAVLAADPAVLPYSSAAVPAGDGPGSSHDAAALLLLTRRETSGGVRLARRSLGGRAIGPTVQEVYDELVGDGPPPCAVVAGPACDGWSPGEGVTLVRPPAGRPASGVWEAVAGLRGGGPVVAVEADPVVGEVAGAWL